MLKRRKPDPNLEEEEDDEDIDNISSGKHRQQQSSQKVYDFHKKTIEVYPERLRELNRQFSSSINSQITTEPYSVLVGNCLDYVRQYFNYEDDLLKYSPWLATRLKQSRSDIVKCLQETIDVYEALARNDFDQLFDKNNNQSTTNKTNNTIQLLTTSSSSQIQPPAATTTTSSSIPSFSFAKSTTTNDSTATTSSSVPSFSFAKSTTTNDSTTTTATTTTSSSIPSFTFTKSTATSDTTTTSSSVPSFNFTKTTTTNDSTPLTGFSFKMPTPTTTASQEKTANNSPFAFSMPHTGFGTSTFNPTFGNSINTEKTSTSTASSISFATPPKFSFTPTSAVNTEQQRTTEENEDEPTEPPEPEKVEHESDAKLSYRCRMGVNKSGKLIKRGPVQVILKEANEKNQLIIRSDDTLGRLYLNILWSKLVVLKKNSTKDLTFVCQLNPGMTEINEGEFVTILLRFDNETDRNDAYEKLDKERK